MAKPRTAAQRRASALKAAETRRRNAKAAGRLERSRDALLGYLRPASTDSIPRNDPDADIRTFRINVYKPSTRAKWPAERVSDDIAERINTIIPGTVKRRSVWQVEIKLPRAVSTETLALLFEKLEGELGSIDMDGGRANFAAITLDGTYLPVGMATEFLNDAIVNGIESLQQDLQKYRSRAREKEADEHRNDPFAGYKQREREREARARMPRSRKSKR